MSLIAILALLSLTAQAPTPDWQAAAGGKLAFDVASVKKQPPGSFRPPLFPLDAGDSFTDTGGRFYANFPVTTYITFAWKLLLTPEQRQAILAGLPKWVSSDVFEIEAKAPMSNPTKDQMRLMMQSLLADRFHLKIHFETRESSVYALVQATPGKLGPKLRPHEAGRSCDEPAPDLFPGRCRNLALTLRPDNTRLGGARDVPMDYIAQGLPTLDRLGRPVVDQTGLSGTFDFTIEWLPVGPAPTPDSDAPSFAEALRVQLGLKLESTKAPVRTPVIDQIESLSEN
ncbi:MAG TPA: TIGR03435 family protein [Bryobacteraceae bacterium]